MSFGSKNQTSTSSNNGSSTTTLSPQVQAAYNSLLSQFGGVSSGTNAATNSATSGLGSLAANPNPAFASSASTLSSAATPAYQSVGNYLSPFISQALQTQIASQNQQNAQQQQSLLGDAVAKGALGGNRVGVAQGQLAGQQAIANNAANSSLLNTGYQEALQGALAGQQGETAAGTAQAGLGSSQTAATLSALLGQLSGGNSQFSNLGTLSGAASGLSNTGATTTTTGSGSATVPGPSLISQIIGLATAGAGMFAKADGGRVPSFDAGGMVGLMADQRELSLSDAISRAQQAIAPPSNDNQANDNSPSGLNSEQQKGVANLKSWFTPQVAPSGGEMGGMGSSYAGGGVVARGYDDGGYVTPPSAFYSSLLDQITNAPDTGPNSYGVPASMPAATSAVPAIKPMTALNAGDNLGFVNPDVTSVPSLPQGMSRVNPDGTAYTPDAPSAAPRGVVPLAPPPKPQVIANAPTPLSAINTASPEPRSNAPLTVATNNPGAITDGAWARSMPGYVGNNGDFAAFDSPASGQAAQLHLLNNYVASGHNTIASIINKWAPPAANAPGSTSNYINYVANRTGIDPNAPVSPDALPAIAKAQSEWESGLKPGGFTPPAGAPDAMAFNGNGAGAPTARVVPPPGTGPAFNSGANGVIPNPGTTTGQPGGGIPGGINVTPPGGYGVPDSNAGYSTNVQDSIKSLLAGHGLNLSPDARMGLISAGAGMMAGTSPFALTNVGTGIQQGLKTWQAKQAQNIETAKANSEIGATQGNLAVSGQQLYLNALKNAADIAQETAAAANTGNEYTSSPYGLIHINKVTGQAEATPWGTVIGGGPQGTPAGSGAAGSVSAPNGTNLPSGSATSGNTDAQGFVTNAPPMAPKDANPMLMNPTTAEIVFGQTKDALSAAQQQSIGAQTLDAQIGQLAALAKNMPATGLLAQGSGFDKRLDAVKTINAALGTLNIAPIAANDVSTAEDMKKLGTQMQAAVANAWKSDPAASTIVQAGSASPSGENSAAGFDRIVGNIQALNKRAVDRFNYLQSWANGHYGDLTGADAAFNAANPPQKYVAYGEKLGQQLLTPIGTASNPLVPTSQADIDNAPSGTVFSINGKPMVKK